MCHGSGNGSWQKLLIRRVEHLKCALRRDRVMVEDRQAEREGQTDRQTVGHKIMARIYQHLKRVDDNLLGCNLNMQMTDVAEVADATHTQTHTHTHTHSQTARIFAFSCVDGRRTTANSKDSTQHNSTRLNTTRGHIF